VVIAVEELEGELCRHRGKRPFCGDDSVTR
jgi:hypothetical protein